MREWHNWVGNQRARVELRQPSNEEELCAAVRAASRSGRRIRPAGASYSWSPLIPIHDGMVIDLRRMKGVHSIDIDAKTIEVDAGMDIKELNRRVTEHGLTLVTPPLFPGPTVGGAVATGSHGTAFASGNFSDDVIEMTIVDHEGNPRVVRRPDGSDPKAEDEFRAAQVSLGTLGVIQKVKLQLADQFNVYTIKRQIEVEEVLANFDDLASRKTCDFLELFYVPTQRHMWVVMMSRTDSHPDRRMPWDGLVSRASAWFGEQVVEKVYPFASRNFQGAYPYIYEAVNRTFGEQGASVATASEAFHFEKIYPKCWDMSYSFDRRDAARAWADGIRLLDSYAEAGRYPCNLMMHGRFTAGSQGWLAPDHGRDTGYVEITNSLGAPQWADCFRELERRWIAIEGSRPHWAKVYFQSGELYDRYPMMDAFLEVRERWDPERVFLNEFLEEEVFRLDRERPAAEPPKPRAPLSPGWQPVAPAG